MRHLLLAALVMLGVCAPVWAQKESDPDEVRKIVAEMLEDAQRRSRELQTPGRMDWWREARFGMFIHWGLYAIPAGEWGGRGGRTDYGEWIRSSAKIPREEYEKLREKFNPTGFNAREWVRLAKSAGMKYITITTKHHDGFCLWDSEVTDWDVMSTPFKRDIIGEMADACREEDVRLCFYYSIMDWHHPDYVPRRDWETWSTEGADFERYMAYMKAQLKELLTKYGPIGVLWFDGQWEGSWNDERGRDLEAYVRGLQPSIIVNSRVGRSGGAWGLDGDGKRDELGDYATPEQTIPDEVPVGVDWETCMTMNGHWGYNRADKNFKSTQDLVRKLVDIASKGGNFLLNVGPTAEGRIPEESVQRLNEMGAWMSANGASIHGTRRGTVGKMEWGRVTEGETYRTPTGVDTVMYLHVFERPADGKLVVKGLLNVPVRAEMMGIGATPLKVSAGADGVVVGLPAYSSNGIDDVVVLQVIGAPDVAKAPNIVAPSLIFVDDLKVAITSTQQRVEVRCTLDGSEPGPQSPVVGDHGVVIRATSIISARSFRDGKPVSPVARLAVTKVELRRSAHLADPKPGLRYEYFQSGGEGPNDGVDFKTLDELHAMKAVKSGVTPGFDMGLRQRDKHWAVRYTGYIKVDASGVYRFATASDDASRLFIADQLVVNNDGPHSFEEKVGDIALAAGYHAITVEFFENTGGFDLKVFWTPPGGPRGPLPVERLYGGS